MDEKLKFKYGPQSTIGIEKKRLRNKGINIRPKGIKKFKVSSKVKEFVIQCTPLK